MELRGFPDCRAFRRARIMLEACGSFLRFTLPMSTAMTMPDLPTIRIWELHPMLVHFPIALLLAGVAVEWATRWRPNESRRRAAAGLLMAGTILGWLAAGAGLLAFLTVPAHTEDAHTLMYWHLGLGTAMLIVFSCVAIVRWRRRTEPVSAGLTCAAGVACILLVFTGYLGGAIVYHGGAGVEPELLSEEIRTGHDHAEGGEKKVGGAGHDHNNHSHERDRENKPSR